ncbi:tryptophan aminotransferase-related protein 4-like [Malania oleifera]|uniref:tryptophan aminotransferase-related protein 4-like n=1 Tax=Malania oleifera TaxID=397392 RepID=UPI0025AE6ADF|nr:tryptophan aminotransferase-related protein 4-like [Malania oleifera]
MSSYYEKGNELLGWRLKLYGVCLLCSVTLNLYYYFWVNHHQQQQKLSWSRGAAEDAEAVASLTCSGHGTAYLDGLLAAEGGGTPRCECNACYGGSDCSQLSPPCVADADSGNPVFLAPFWREHAASSAVVVAGWHRMGYSFPDTSDISPELETHIRALHAVVGNAVTAGRFIVFGTGSTHLLNAAVYALSATRNSSSPAGVVASIPFYPVYEKQTELYHSVDFEFQGDASLWKNSSSKGQGNFIEFVTSPNNPDGELKEAVLEGPSAKTIHDRAYYWPHFTAIPAAADDDLMIFTLSKLTGHAGSRFGWALIKDEAVYQRMVSYIMTNTAGVSKDTQLRTLKLLKVVLEDGGKKIFGFGYETMKNRWEKLSKTISMSKRLSIQQLVPLYCNYFRTVRGPSPAYAWLKCEREEDRDCPAMLRAANVIGRNGSLFRAENRYVRLSLIKSQDDFDLLLQKLEILVSEEADSDAMTM